MRKIKMIGVILCCSLIVTGCNVTNISIAEKKEEINVEMSWWGSDTRTAYTMESLNQYEKENTNINISMTYGEYNGFELKNDVKMFSHTEADVMQLDFPWMKKYEDMGLGFYDLNSLAKYINLDNYEEEVLSYGTNSSGTLISLPIALNVKVVWYNKTVYDKYGLDIPKTWDDLFEAAKVMKKDNVYPLDMESTSVWMGTVAYVEQTTGKQVFHEDGSFAFSEKEVNAMLRFYKRLVDEGVVAKVADRSESNISDGTYAGTMQWVSGAAKYEEMIRSNGSTVVAALAPSTDGEKRPGWYIKPATLYAIGEHTENPEEAAKLLSYLVEDEEMVLRQKLEKGIPCNKKALEILEKNDELSGIQYDASQLAEEKGYPLMHSNLDADSYATIMQEAADKVIYNEATVSQAAKEAYKKFCALDE